VLAAVGRWPTASCSRFAGHRGAAGDRDPILRARRSILPGGGGSYIVRRDNLGELPAQIAGAALLTDYVLTVRSQFPRIAQVFSLSAIVHLPRGIRGRRRAVHHAREFCVREGSGAFFAMPAYFFIAMIAD